MTESGFNAGGMLSSNSMSLLYMRTLCWMSSGLPMRMSSLRLYKRKSYMLSQISHAALNESAVKDGDGCRGIGYGLQASDLCSTGVVTSSTKDLSIWGIGRWGAWLNAVDHILWWTP